MLTRSYRNRENRANRATADRKESEQISDYNIIQNRRAEILLGDTFNCQFSIVNCQFEITKLFEKAFYSRSEECKVILYGVVCIVLAERGGDFGNGFPVVGIASQKT